MLEAVYLIRHAQPDRTTNIPYNTVPGPSLTPAGREEAAEAARWLAGRGVEYLFSSPFARTVETADTLADQLGLPVTYVEALREAGPGETQERVRARVSELLTQIDDGPLRRIGLVTHGMCVKMLLLHTTSDKIDLNKHVYDYGNCSPTAGIWLATRGDNFWRWELVFRPSSQL